MKILFLARYFYPHIGGVEKHVEAISRELMKQGHQVIVLTMKHGQKLKDQETYHGIKIIRIPYCDSKWGIWQNLWPKRQLFQQVNVIHCHDIFFWYLPFRFLYPFKPVFTTFHGWEGQFPIPKKNIWLRKIWEKLSWGNICVGDYLEKWYGTKANYITYGGVERNEKLKTENAPSLKAMAACDEKLKECIFIGRLEKDLGLEEYLKAFNIIKKKFGFKITFVGDGPFRKPAESTGQVTGFVKDLKHYLKRPAYIFASSYLTIWGALSYGRQVFALHQNPLKRDYLEKFPAVKNIHLSGSVNELISQLNKPRSLCRQLPSWQAVAKIYLKLWGVK